MKEEWERNDSKKWINKVREKQNKEWGIILKHKVKNKIRIPNDYY